MPTVRVRDVPDEVAAVIAEKTSTEHRSVSAYLRDSIAADVRRELQRRAIAECNEELRLTQRRLGVTGRTMVSGVEVVREIRDGYDRDDQ